MTTAMPRGLSGRPMVRPREVVDPGEDGQIQGTELSGAQPASFQRLSTTEWPVLVHERRLPSRTDNSRLCGFLRACGVFRMKPHSRNAACGRTVTPMVDTARELLRDSFTRLIEHVEDITDGLTDEVAFFRPTSTANSIAWLIWHSARIQDAQVADIAGSDQVWCSGGWVDRFALPLPRDAHGYGHTPEEVGKVRAPADLLAAYYRAVHKMTLEYVAGITTDELVRVVDINWTPPVTVSARLVSIIDDCAQHLGQAAYIEGLAP